MKNSSDTIGNRTRDLPALPTAPPRAPTLKSKFSSFRGGSFRSGPRALFLDATRSTIKFVGPCLLACLCLIKMK
jgi:hypothetical protein